MEMSQLTCVTEILNIRESSPADLLLMIPENRREECTSLTDKAERKPLMVGLTLLKVLRLTLIAGMDPLDMTVTFFGIIPPPRGVATVVPVNFA